MSLRLVDMWYDVSNNFLRDSDGGVLAVGRYPFITFRENVLVNLQLVTDSDLTPYTRFDNTDTFQITVDNDIDNLQNMVKTLDNGINQPGDWEKDSAALADATQGEFSAKLNGNTTPFADRIAEAEALTNTVFELLARNSSNTIIAVLRMPMYSHNLQGDAGQDPTSDGFGWVEFIDEASGEQCARLTNSDGQVLETACPTGVSC